MPATHSRVPTSPMSVRSNSSTGSASSFSYRSPVVAPSPLQQQLSSSSASDSSQSHGRWHSSSLLHEDSAEMDSRELGLGLDLDPLQRHFVTAYSQADLKTFHCDRVRKMPLSGLDPSMLLGFLCKDEEEWLNLKDRITEVRTRPLRNPGSLLSVVLRFAALQDKQVYLLSGERAATLSVGLGRHGPRIYF